MSDPTNEEMVESATKMAVDLDAELSAREDTCKQLVEENGALRAAKEEAQRTLVLMEKQARTLGDASVQLMEQKTALTAQLKDAEQNLAEAVEARDLAIAELSKVSRECGALQAAKEALTARVEATEGRYKELLAAVSVVVNGASQTEPLGRRLDALCRAFDAHSRSAEAPAPPAINPTIAPGANTVQFPPAPSLGTVRNCDSAKHVGDVLETCPNCTVTEFPPAPESRGKEDRFRGEAVYSLEEYQKIEAENAELKRRVEEAENKVCAAKEFLRVYDEQDSLTGPALLTWSDRAEAADKALRKTLTGEKECPHKAGYDNAKKEIENLTWNLAGCDCYANGWADPVEGHAKELERPALISVRKMALQKKELETKLQAAQDTIEKEQAARNDYKMRFERAMERAQAAEERAEYAEKNEALWHDNCKTLEQSLASKSAALSEAKEYVQIAVKFLKYQTRGKEFYPNREGAEACLGRIQQALTPAPSEKAKDTADMVFGEMCQQCGNRHFVGNPCKKPPAQERDEALEEAAKKVDGWYQHFNTAYIARVELLEISKSIRALLSKPGDGRKEK